MAITPCPFLGTLDEQYNPGAPIDYPSFENHCLAADDQDTLLLADQATYCLSGGYRHCPRYRSARAMANPSDPAAIASAPLPSPGSSPLASDQLRPGAMSFADDDERMAARRRWAWFGAGVMFITVVLCGAMFATYTGWLFIQETMAQQVQAGRVATLASAPATAAAPQWVVMTATDQPPPPSNTPAAIAIQPVQQQADAFPVAVTPTPVPPDGNLATIQSTENTGGDAQLIVVEPQTNNVILPPPAEAPIDIQLLIPTRRPTPVFDIPTSTAEPTTPTPTPTITLTPTPIGTPFVVFGAAEAALEDGKCTIVSWNVQNVKEVYYENIGVNGRGQKEECINDLREVYKLAVVLPDGATRLYTTTVVMLMPTPTPLPTATFTPEPVLTPTWTPLPPTPTATSSVVYGVAVNINGSTQQSCVAGSQCDIGLVVINTGNEVDNLLVGIAEQGAWSAMLCRADGVCANNNLAITSVGPGNSAYIVLRVSVAGDAAGQVQSYGVQAVSSGSGGATSSGVTQVEITAQ
jgi:hypothetical protein